VGLGTDCFGAAQPAIRYDSPTWGGFRFETSWGKQEAINPMTFIPLDAFEADINTPDSNFWDIAVFYTADWNSIKLSVAAAYTWMETGALSVPLSAFETDRDCDEQEDFFVNCGENADLFQIGASIMHTPSGLGIYGLYQTEDGNYRYVNVAGNLQGSPTTDVWYLKPFWRKAWSPIGATVLYGEYGRYEDQFIGGAGASFWDYPVLWNNPNADEAQVNGSEVERWGLGVVQEIDSAAMHLYARWQHQELDVDLRVLEFDGSLTNASQSFDDFDVFQVGGIIFF
jgi:hypothetical protein